MKELERRIYVSQDIINNEYDYVYGNKKETEVHFAYYNFKKDRESTPIKRTYRDALALARGRANDGRYKNFEFLIY